METWTIPCITLRPYQLACLLCMLGEDRADECERARFEALNREPFWRAKHSFLRDVMTQVRQEPDTPVALRCNAGGVFAWQAPGADADSPEGADFNMKRDLDLLERLDLPPGCVLPARSLFYRMQNHLETVRGVCGYDQAASPAWQGCPKAASGFYERGRRLNVDDYIPLRSDAARAREKAESLAAMRQAASIRIRPHILLCAVCQYGGGTRPPLDADNLPECLEYVMERPQTPMTLVPGADWMMCAPCKRRTAAGACVNVCGHGGLENELRDLIVLQILGLSYGATLAAGDLFALMFERIPVTTPVCSRAHVKTSIWWDTCAERPEGSAAYVKGREELMRQGFGVRRP